MQANRITPTRAPNQDHPKICIAATTFSGSDKSPKAVIIRPNVEPSRPVIMPKNILMILGLLVGAGWGDIGRGLGCVGEAVLPDGERSGDGNGCGVTRIGVGVPAQGGCGAGMGRGAGAGVETGRAGAGCGLGAGSSSTSG